MAHATQRTVRRVDELARVLCDSVHSKKIYTACQRHTRGSVREEMLTFLDGPAASGEREAAGVKIFNGLRPIKLGAGTYAPEERFLMHGIQNTSFTDVRFPQHDHPERTGWLPRRSA